jgi:hypothetical protein
MSDAIDAFRDDDDVLVSDDGSAALEPPAAEPELFYGSVDEFVREYLRHVYTRPVGPGNARYRWAARWWDYPEAIARLEALWRSWEHLRQDAATGASTWWRDHADHHMSVLLSPDGPFARSKDSCEPGQPLPYKEPPTGWFPDMRG